MRRRKQGIRAGDPVTAAGVAAPGARPVVSLPPRFASLEADVGSVLAEYQLRRIDAETAAQQLSRLTISEGGFEWTVGASSGAWYRRIGEFWERADPTELIDAPATMSAGVLPLDPTIGPDPLGPPPALTRDGIGGESTHIETPEPPESDSDNPFENLLG